ncbi:hypothetical protein ACROYT_G035924, partial [Oculina patagonica]
TVEALVSGHPRDAKKVSVTGAGRLREWFSYAATRGVGDKWPLKGACPANNNRTDVDDDKTGTEIWYCNHFKIIVTNGDVKLIDKHKMQRLLIGFSLVCLLTGA